MIENLTERVRPWFQEAFEACGEPDLVWDSVPMVHPQKGLVLYVGCVVPGALLGTVLSNGLAIPTPSVITAESAKGIVASLVEQIQQSRTAQLQLDPGQQDAVLDGSMFDLAPGT